LAIECLYFGEKNAFSKRINGIVEEVGCRLENPSIHKKDEGGDYRGIFVIQLDELGGNNEFHNWLLSKKRESPSYFDKSIVGLIIKSDCVYYTKKFASNIVFLLNEMGARILGHSVIEFIKNYENLKKWELAENLSTEGVIQLMVRRLLNRISEYSYTKKEVPKILVLHAGTHEKSNTLALWRMVRQHIPHDNITEFHVEEGTAIDCYGCSFDTCTYYSTHNSCLYGGVITEELLPLIEASDVIVWICPNYNDAISAKLSAVINRLTVLYRRVSFNEKKIYTLIVSANSGSDSVASQLIDALIINKGFQLPPNFALTALASDQGSILKVPSIEKESESFAQRLVAECL